MQVKSLSRTYCLCDTPGTGFCVQYGALPVSAVTAASSAAPWSLRPFTP
jgi:hypothetical protein